MSVKFKDPGQSSTFSSFLFARLLNGGCLEDTLINFIRYRLKV